MKSKTPLMKLIEQLEDKRANSPFPIDYRKYEIIIELAIKFLPEERKMVEQAHLDGQLSPDNPQIELAEHYFSETFLQPQ